MSWSIIMHKQWNNAQGITFYKLHRDDNNIIMKLVLLCKLASLAFTNHLLFINFHDSVAATCVHVGVAILIVSGSIVMVVMVWVVYLALEDEQTCQTLPFSDLHKTKHTGTDIGLHILTKNYIMTAVYIHKNYVTVYYGSNNRYNRW